MPGCWKFSHVVQSACSGKNSNRMWRVVRVVVGHRLKRQRARGAVRLAAGDAGDIELLVLVAGHGVDGEAAVGVEVAALRRAVHHEREETATGDGRTEGMHTRPAGGAHRREVGDLVLREEATASVRDLRIARARGRPTSPCVAPDGCCH